MQQQLNMVTMSEAYAKAIAAWQYPGQYAIYNLPPWDDMCAKQYSLAVKEKREGEYKAFVTADNKLMAMCRYTAKDGGLMLGVGVNPNYVSHGIGTAVVKQFTAWLRDNYPDKRLYLEVRAWNERAVKCYIRCGYVISETFHQTTPAGEGEFYRLYYAGE